MWQACVAGEQKYINHEEILNALPGEECGKCASEGFSQWSARMHREIKAHIMWSKYEYIFSSAPTRPGHTPIEKSYLELHPPRLLHCDG
jgi:hypothetical protein